jgi:tRNA(Ser,Leu) C12 N-acetylase TAN1
MAGPDTGGKRPRAEGGGGGDRKRNRHRYARGASGGNVSRTLPHGSRGFVVSCDPRHEVQCFREAYVLLAEQIEARWPELGARLGGPRRTAEVAPAGDGGSAGVAATPAAGVADAVADEVKALRESKKAHGVLQNVDLGVQGSVFVRVVDEAIAVEEVVESVLRAARENGNPGSRHCVRFVPAHATCYAKPEDAAAAAAKVCLRHFPAGKCTYGIQFRGRMNTSAKRDEYVKACADAVEAAEPGRFSVNLSEPDVVLCVEVIKTQCVVGAFRHYYELAKLNIREVCKAKEVVEKEKERAAELQLAAERRRLAPGRRKQQCRGRVRSRP